MTLDWMTVRTCRGLLMAELKRLKLEHKTCDDVHKRRKRVGRIEVLRAALAALDRYAHGQLLRRAERLAQRADEFLDEQGDQTPDDAGDDSPKEGAA